MILYALICIAILALYGAIPGALEWVDGAPEAARSDEYRRWGIPALTPN